MAETFFHEFFKCFFIAFGILLGGSLIGGFATFIIGKPLYTSISQISESIRIWAVIAAIGGTFDTLASFEKGFLNSETKELFKQFLLILSAMGGAQAGTLILSWLIGEHISL